MLLAVPAISLSVYSQPQLEWIKWVALISMTLDHYGKIVDPSLFDETHAIGRLSFPLFSWIMASRLSVAPDAARKYLIWLLPWALISQPIYVVAGKEWMQWNIMFTLLFGVMIYMSLEQVRQGHWLCALPLLVVALAGSVFVDYGSFGVAMIPVLAECLKRGKNIALMALVPLSLAANMNFEAPYFSAIDLCAALSVLFAYLSYRDGITIPRLSKFFFYAYYPAHLYILHITDLYLL